MTDPDNKKAPDANRADHSGQAGQAGQLPAQKAMKQFAKTDAERQEPEGPNDGPALTQHEREGKPPGCS